jgi:uncharacterized protein HemY
MVSSYLSHPISRYASIPPLLCVGVNRVGLYLGVAYITYATLGFYVYTFLDPSIEHAKLAAYIVGIAVVAIVVFVIANLIAWGLSRVVGAKQYEDWRDRYAARRGDANLETGKI